MTMLTTAASETTAVQSNKFFLSFNISYDFCMDFIFKYSFSNRMKKSTIVALPVVPFNQSKLSDVCQYLDYLQNFLRSLPLPEVLILL